MEKTRQFYIVSETILPDAIVKTAKAKEMLAKGEVKNIRQAVDQANISRSAFYKYRDGIFPFYQEGKEKIVTINMILEHCSGILSGVINLIALEQGNILTINQGLPLQGMANVNVSLETASMRVTTPELIKKLLSLRGVLKAELVGQSV